MLRSEMVKKYNDFINLYNMLPSGAKEILYTGEMEKLEDEILKDLMQNEFDLLIKVDCNTKWYIYKINNIIKIEERFKKNINEIAKTRIISDKNFQKYFLTGTC